MPRARASTSSSEFSGTKKSTSAMCTEISRVPGATSSPGPAGPGPILRTPIASSTSTQPGGSMDITRHARASTRTSSSAGGTRHAAPAGGSSASAPREKGASRISCSSSTAAVSVAASPAGPMTLNTRASGCLLWRGHRSTRTSRRWRVRSEARLVNKRTLGRRRSAGTARTELRAAAREDSPVAPRSISSASSAETVATKSAPRGRRMATTSPVGTGGASAAESVLVKSSSCAVPRDRGTRCLTRVSSVSPVSASFSSSSSSSSSSSPRFPARAATASVPRAHRFGGKSRIATSSPSNARFRAFRPGTKTSPPVGNTVEKENASSSEHALTVVGKPSSVKSLPRAPTSNAAVSSLASSSIGVDSSSSSASGSADRARPSRCPAFSSSARAFIETVFIETTARSGASARTRSVPRTSVPARRPSAASRAERWFA